MSVDRPVTEYDLHAFVDNALDPIRRSEVQEYLNSHVDVARQVEAIAAQRNTLREALAPIANEPIPPQLDLARIIKSKRQARHDKWHVMAAHIARLGMGRTRAAHTTRSTFDGTNERTTTVRIAASVALVALGALAGWFANDLTAPPRAGIASLAQEAAATYRVYAPDETRPVEFGPANTRELLQWVSVRLQRPVAVPDLAKSGYRFMGGRLVATPHGPAALFLYDDDHGTRVAMLVRPMAIERNAPMSEHTEGELANYAWSNQGLGYSLVATAPSATLHPLADEIRRQIDSST
jgi:anti-sigma factor RsiW